jgi:hypothetical protein
MVVAFNKASGSFPMSNYIEWAMRFTFKSLRRVTYLESVVCDISFVQAWSAVKVDSILTRLQRYCGRSAELR